MKGTTVMRALHALLALFLLGVAFVEFRDGGVTLTALSAAAGGVLLGVMAGTGKGG